VGNAAVFVGPALVVAAIALALVAPVGFLIGIGLLALAAGTLSLAWRPGNSPERARAALGIAGAILGLAAAGFGLAANSCTANPAIVAVVSFLLFEGTLLGSVAVGRSVARSGGLFLPFSLAAGLGLVGFFVSVFRVAQDVFVLC
jgi:hypothetical protein